MAKRKLAIGPAETMAARCPRRLCGNATARSSSLITSFPSAGMLAALASPNIFTYPPSGIRLNFQRVPADLFALAIRPRAVPPRDQVVAEFVDEDQGREHGQERQAETVESSRKIHDLQRYPTVIH